MKILIVVAVWLAVWLLPGCCVLRAQDAKSAVQQAVKVEIAKDEADHSCWVFHEVDQKPGNSVVQWVAQTSEGSVTRVLSKNGQTIPLQKQRNSVESFVRDVNAQARQRRDNQRDDNQAAGLLKLLPVAFLWTETSENGDTTTYHFKPDPKFQPPNREARVFAAMEGDMTVNTREQRIQELQGRLIHDVTFGYGLLGRLQRGGTFEVERREIGGGVWQITESHIHIHGHALLFKTISEEEDDVKTSFTREPDGVTLEQAASEVMSEQE
jgi:hypothetical protein